jgi:hypothetical protein
MLTIPTTKVFIISDNFYPKKLTKYSCYTLTNIKVKTTTTNEIKVFRNRESANVELALYKCEYGGYNVHSINVVELQMLCDCFDMKMMYE